MDELLQPGRLSILLLSGVPDDVRLALIYLLIRKLLQARAAASEAAKSAELGFGGDEAERQRIERVLASAPPKSWVVIDEAQNVFPSEKQTSASATLLRFVREGRNFGLSLAFTTQQPTAIDPRIMAQVDTFIVHTLTVDRDITAVRNSLKAPEPARAMLEGTQLGLADSIRRLEVGQAFVSAVDAERSIFVDIRPRVSIHGGFEG
ncbi:ATP-binding protein [Aquihabitans daechungensis]|uniref:ATP-binding protein n=1 Tax=Aquihabitans daechungensis TaxID=1052257 RepID=UPI003BA12450